MAGIVALPARGEAFLDTRDDGRAMRLSWHLGSELVVLSVWRGHACVATFQLDEEEVPRLIEALASGLSASHPGREASPGRAMRGAAR